MSARVEHPSVEERRAHGKKLRKKVSPSGHAGWKPAADRPDPVALLEEQDATREPDLVPVRHGRMMVSPFTFYRGAAKIMAADLKDTPRAGLTVQLCGDAHLSNFGLFASPERKLLFDLNDFDETLPGPFEYDVKRMSASFTIAARNNGFSKAEAREATLASVSAYRTAMAEFAEMGTMDVWYARLTEQELMKAISGFAAEELEAPKKAAKKEKKAAKKEKKRAKKIAEKARTRDSLQALSKLGELVDGRYRIVSQPPIVVPARDATRRATDLGRRDPARDARAVPRLPGDPAGRSATSAGAVRGRRRRSQGRRRRKRRHRGVHRLAPRPRPAGPAVPPGQGGDGVGARGPSPEEPLQATR